MYILICILDEMYDMLSEKITQVMFGPSGCSDGCGLGSTKPYSCIDFIASAKPDEKCIFTFE